ncbi:only proline and serine are matching in the corresponding protein [Colletotrichum karsti]|uniref:Only proline and serine are matching in the corresponding protein n=1 Tax=Colletotrichum karsti TaxID=1095194 RepID=A0A9P6LJX8_9PEZI|nr:only proline and serine are matching in the corresponding protein [Colletotrichum karsti]KAF9876133.1 only proline and serine are matching in the corresponding protein [Colletotrichum karsti]
MSPQLKPLLLPQLVERRKLEEQHLDLADADMDHQCIYYTTNSSSSDVASPVTPTFSTRGHLRYSSSSSSIDLTQTYCNDSPASPTSTSHSKSSKRPLPDVQEEPLERDEFDESTILAEPFDLYNCLCDEPCIHSESSETLPSSVYPADFDIDYDLGFASDADYSANLERKRSGTESPFSGLATRIGTRFPQLSRFKSTRRAQLTASPTTELTFETAHPVSLAASSRSSSLSSPCAQVHEPSISTPATSFWESSESVDIPAPIDIQKANERESIERDRALASTPLLPPLLTSPQTEAPQPSPLQSPTVAPTILSMEVPSTQSLGHIPTPSLSTRPSVSSFRHVQSSQELPFGYPSILQDHDEWSDRLGHANFSIAPQPYEPEAATMESLRLLRADWEAARANYMKHLVRTGENYGETSKIYALTEAKWAEIEKSWRAFHEQTMERIVASSKVSAQPPQVSRSRSRGRGRVRSSSGGSAILRRPVNDDVFANEQWRRLEDNLPTTMPRLVDTEGKFPERGDEDIVGPMERDTKMIRARSEERKSSRFWRSLAGKVGLRK